ncbi:BFD-like [2Fe-2S] binding domain protein [Botrimarina colliarenosi]|uniref:BFD-like [2Fe-2S] binding domain protein n=1 Tax=Botrimarina colliarenosi TaxID=2528001 RepID=A0A5C6AMA6_9BACT|nr:(2Fe-2S)-binding protein [Botrimarina colliarenosi]TWU00132.1 BFD-like [2Fe-2S] binding domain protein [Botrimarina colliarenosi]
MQPDDELCLCFHVTRRKVENYLRVERPAAPSQLADCYGAGTGCGWCRPLLRKLFEAQRAQAEADLPDAADHASGRGEHIATGGGTPPK